MFDFDSYIYADTTMYARFTKIQSSDEGMTVEEGVLTGYTGNAKKTVIPADVHTISTQSSFYTPYNNEKYEVAAGNNFFTAVDGVLFSKDKTVLVAYPRNKAGSSYSIPASVKTIGKRAIYYNHNLEIVTLPEGVEIIDHWAFLGSKIKHINIPESVTYIGVQAFSTEIADPITVSQSVKTIYGSAFLGVKSKSITINAQITKLYSKLFYNCTELEYVVLPATLTTIAEDVFSNCTALKDIYFMGTEEQWEAIDKSASGLPETGITMHYAEEPPEPVGNVVANFGGNTVIFTDLTTLGKDKVFKSATGKIEITISTDLTAVQTITLPSKATSVTLKAPKAHKVAIKAATLTCKGDLTVENFTLISGKKNTGLTAKGVLTVKNSTVGVLKVTGTANISGCAVTGKLAASGELIVTDTQCSEDVSMTSKTANIALKNSTAHKKVTSSGGVILTNGSIVEGAIKATGVLTLSVDSSVKSSANVGGIAVAA